PQYPADSTTVALPHSYADAHQHTHDHAYLHTHQDPYYYSHLYAYTYTYTLTPPPTPPTGPFGSVGGSGSLAEQGGGGYQAWVKGTYSNGTTVNIKANKTGYLPASGTA